MKLVILYSCILLTMMSCGGKKETGKASFKLLLGGSTSALIANQFPGGLLLMGRRIDGGQSFKLRFTEGLALDLQKGNWEFATIGWFEVGYNGNMQGNQKCSYRQVELKEDNQSIAFELSAASCLTLTTSQGEKFADSQFLNLNNGSSTFRTLKINTCGSIDSIECYPYTGSINSVRVTIPAELEGISMGVAPQGLSECVEIVNGYGTKYLTLPLGGESSFIKTRITKFSSNNCLASTNVETIDYLDGLGGRADFKSKLSPGYSLGSAGIKFINKGIWSSNLVPPDGSNGDTYLLNANISLLSAFAGDYIVFHNGNWERVIESNEMSVSADGKIYFSSYQAYLFLSEI